jgi:hypothetical protein
VLKIYSVLMLLRCCIVERSGKSRGKRTKGSRETAMTTGSRSNDIEFDIGGNINDTYSYISTHCQVPGYILDIFPGISISQLDITLTSPLSLFGRSSLHHTTRRGQLGYSSTSSGATGEDMIKLVDGQQGRNLRDDHAAFAGSSTML